MPRAIVLSSYRSKTGYVYGWYGNAWPLLSHQQTKVIKGLLEGKTVLLIGRELHLDTRTISLHRSRAIKKLRLLLGVTA